MANRFTRENKTVKYMSDTPKTDGENNTNDGSFTEGNLPWMPYDFSSLNPIPQKLKIEYGKSYTFAVVPVEVTENHPRVTTNRPEDKLEVGDPTDCTIVRTHKEQGPNNNVSFICGRQWYNPLKNEKNCPICERADMNKTSGTREDHIAFSSKRCLMNILLLEDGNWVPYYIDHYYDHFYHGLNEKAQETGESLGIGRVDFSYPGKTNDRTGEKAWIINATFDRVTRGEFSFPVLGKTVFKPRDWELTDEHIDNAIQFEKYLKWFTYKETQDLMEGYSANPYTIANGKDENTEEDNEKTVTNVDDAIGMNEAIMRANASEPVSTPRTRDKPKEDVCPFGHRFGYDCQKEGLAECKDTSDKGCPDESYTKCSDELERLKNAGLVT